MIWRSADGLICTREYDLGGQNLSKLGQGIPSTRRFRLHLQSQHALGLADEDESWWDWTCASILPWQRHFWTDTCGQKKLLVKIDPVGLAETFVPSLYVFFSGRRVLFPNNVETEDHQLAVVWPGLAGLAEGVVGPFLVSQGRHEHLEVLGVFVCFCFTVFFFFFFFNINIVWNIVFNCRSVAVP